MTYDKTKKFANKGVARNKSPLPNILYKFEIYPPEQITKEKLDSLEEFKFKDEGYIVMEWTNRPMDKKTKEYTWYWHGFISPLEIKKLLGEKQYSKFCQGKRLFIIQRRINKKNVSKK